MIGVVATFKIQDGKGPEFEALFADLSAKVRANEPGALMYQLTKSRAEPDTYKVLELYKDDEAVKLHGGTEYFKAAFGEMRQCLAGRPEVEYLDGV